MVPPGAGTPEQRPAFLPAAQERILAQPDGKARFGHAVHELSKAFALAVPHAEAQGLRDDVAFFQAVRAALLKRSPAAKSTCAAVVTSPARTVWLRVTRVSTATRP